MTNPTPTTGIDRDGLESARASLADHLDDFDRENNDDSDAEDFNIGQDEYIEVWAARTLAKEQAETIASLTATLEYAEDRLHEINVSNYDHDDVCRLNERSVEVILAIRHTLKDVSRCCSGGDAVNILHRPRPKDCQEGRAPLE